MLTQLRAWLKTQFSALGHRLGTGRLGTGRLHTWLVALFSLTLGLSLVLQACDRSIASSFPAPNRPGADYTDRMAQEHKGDRPIATPLSQMEPQQPVATQRVDYATINGKTITGFLAQPANAEAPLPALIAIHEWWGLNDNIEAVSQRLAGEGYSVLAVDLYGGELAEAPDQARSLMQGVMADPEPAQENLRQAYEYLINQQQATGVASIGWCFGGAWSLNTALLLPEQLDAAVIYYGRLQTDPEVLAPLQMPIAGFFGGLDQGIPVADVKAFEAALRSLGKTAEIYIYDDANHAFSNPSGDRYNPEAAADAWEKTIAFLAKYLKA
ncbi:MAG: dienelactone hydrolase family protein [Synechococcales cyanobacterium RM1_1_8]|nr:dienelactone hydrolase family protein [Synechococcales cyanobacterium RM1_1_8]